MLTAGAIITQELWDNTTLEVADLQATLFVTPKGQAGKTLYDTNMVQGGQLPKGWRYQIMALSWHVEPDMPLAGAIALSKGTYELHISNKIWAEGVLNTLCSGGGPTFDYNAAPIPVAEIVVRMGTAMSNNLKQLSRAIPLSPSEAFRVEFRWAVAPGVKKFWFVLHGELQRGLN